MRQLRSITIITTATAAATGLVAQAVTAPAQAGSLSGTAAFREPNALPPDAVFEAVLIDAASADAPARELGRVRPVLNGGPNQPLSLQLVAAGTGRPPLTSFPLGRLPASWRGDLAFAGGRTRWQVDLSADGSFQLRQIFLDRPAPNRFDDIGRWRIEPGSNRLVLRGGREAPLFFQPLEGGAALAKLDLQGEPIRSRQPDRLQRLAIPQPIDPRLHLAGMFRYLADAANIRLCATGARLPVAMEADYLRLERAYLKAQPAERRGQPLLVNLEGLITNRPSAEPGQPPQRTLVVERFVGVHPGRGCPQPNTSSSPTSRPMAPLSLRGTLWRLQALQDSSGPTLIEPPGRPPELLLAVDQERVSGTDGCNRLIGAFQLAAEELSFSRLASTKMACLPEVMAFERRYSEALAKVRRWSIDKRNLLLQDAAGRTLLLFRDSP
ncbi:META domain-containing protein [Vulcanococcus limneticus]|uniref:META domain-containing protein n=1 Tax=Vulcanococcus limneticus TaxID=2170428 RepID=UPI00398BC75B